MNHNFFLLYSELIFIFLLLESLPANLKSISNIRNVQNHYSEIDIVIQGSGEQTFISGYYEGTDNPSEVYVEGVKKASCVTSCNLEGSKSKITLRFENQLTSIAYMFGYLSNLIEVDLSNFDASKVETMQGLFSSCSNLENVIFGNIDTSSLVNIRALFSGCSKLTSIDLSSFSKSKSTTMYGVFNGCSNLKEINFGNLDTSLVNTMENLFQDCSQLTSINLTNFKTSEVTSMYNMFHNCVNLKYLDLSGFDTSKVTTVSNIFNKCSSLIFLNLKSFKLQSSAKVYTPLNGISSYVKYCIEDTATQNLLEIPSSDCSDVCFKKYINIDTTNNICVEDLCSNPENKYIYQSTCYSSCPEGTYELDCEENESGCTDDNNKKQCLDTKPEGYYLDEENKIYKKCFERCSKCVQFGDETYNNCLECKDNYVFLKNNMNVNNCYEICSDYHYFDELNKFHCVTTCPDEYNKKIINKTKCIDDCEKDDIYKYEYNNICYEEKIVLTTTIINQEEKVILTTDIINQEEKVILTTDIINQKEKVILTTDIINQEEKIISSTNIINQEEKIVLSTNIINQEQTEKYTSFTKINDVIQNLEEQYSIKLNILNKNDQDNDINMNIIKEILQSSIPETNNDNNNNNQQSLSLIDIQEKVLGNIKRIYNKGFDTKNIDKGHDISFSIDKVIYTLTTSSNQKNLEKIKKIYNDSTINLGECENKLKKNYRISKNKDLYIFKLDFFINKIRKVEYDVYYPFNNSNFTILDLSICKNSKIDISIPADIPINDIDKHNKSSPLYNDICFPASSKNGTDMILKVRRDEYVNKNLSICEEDCDFNKYDQNNKRAFCSCYTKIKFPLISEIKFDKDKILSNFENINNIANFQMIKCWKLLYNKNNLFKNSANYISIVLFILSIISIYVFILFNVKNIKIYLMQFSNNKNDNEKKTKNNDINIESNYKKNKNKNKNKKKSTNRRKNNLLNFQNNQKKVEQNSTLNIAKNEIINLNINHINNNFIINAKQESEGKKIKRKLKESKIKKNKRTRNKIELNESKNTSNALKIKNIDSSNQILTLKKDKLIKNKKFISYNDYELNNLSYEEAKLNDYRTYCQYYISLLRTKHIFIFTFCYNQDYNSQMIKIYIFFFTFALNYLISTMFYSDSTMEKIYNDDGSFDFTYQLPKMFYSLVISSFLKFLINFLGLYEQKIILYKMNGQSHFSQKTLSIIKLKIAFFFIITYIVLFFLWIFLGCFCAVYKNTQIHLLLEVSSSFCLSFITPFFIYLLPGLFRIPSLKKNTQRPMMYKFSKFLQLL